jgi:hypothetical protein
MVKNMMFIFKQNLGGEQLFSVQLGFGTSRHRAVRFLSGSGTHLGPHFLFQLVPNPLYLDPLQPLIFGNQHGA